VLTRNSALPQRVEAGWLSLEEEPMGSPLCAMVMSPSTSPRLRKPTSSARIKGVRTQYRSAETRATIGTVGVRTGSLYASDRGCMLDKYDFAILHFDLDQKDFYYESQWNGTSDLEGGQNWFAAYPLGKLPYDIYLVVEITPEQAKTAQGLPKLPPELPPIKR
jgi:hypothetical protein